MIREPSPKRLIFRVPPDVTTIEGYALEPYEPHPGAPTPGQELIPVVPKKDLPDDAPVTLTIRWRDDGAEEWSREYGVVIGGRGSRGIKEVLKRIGTYRTRQYEFSFFAGGHLSIIACEEEVTITNGY